MTNPHHKTVLHLRFLSNLLDRAIGIPGTQIRIGIDPLLGLLPVGGDIVSGIFSLYIIWRSAQLGLPREILLQMANNVFMDTIAGSVPVAGDVLDFAWKSNSRNVDLLEEYLQLPKKSSAPDLWFVVILISGLLAVIVISSLVLVSILNFIFRLIFSG